MSVVFFTDRDLGLRFPQILKDAGLAVERHADHFAHDCKDEVWLAAIGERGWIALTHNKRIRYMPNQLAAVMSARVALMVVMGKAPYPVLANNFVASRSRIEAFMQRHSAPYIAKIHRPSSGALARNPHAAGRIELWYPHH